jgi:phosphatidylserine/phosphatidylglycerophosphate/cardiolipin synthase-like enzyme
LIANPASPIKTNLIIDEQTVIGGSCDYSNAAEKRNAENVTFIKSQDLAGQYLAHFTSRLRESAAY